MNSFTKKNIVDDDKIDLLVYAKTSVVLSVGPVEYVKKLSAGPACESIGHASAAASVPIVARERWTSPPRDFWCAVDAVKAAASGGTVPRPVSASTGPSTRRNARGSICRKSAWI